ITGRIGWGCGDGWVGMYIVFTVAFVGLVVRFDLCNGVVWDSGQ
ncbi:10625_t:CDS:2, partial [Dentiscutata heterogama]